MRLENKVAIITGGGGGLGEAMAKLFAKEGAKVTITGRNTEKLEKVVKSIEQDGGKALAVPGSVTVEADVQNTVASCLKTFGKIDILVNNAGSLFHAGLLHETTDELWTQTLDIFLTGTFRFSRAVIPQMLKQKSGSILNISSAGGLRAIPGYDSHAYSAAKAGVINLTKTVAIAYAKTGIRCNCICPSGVETPGILGYTTDPEMHKYLDMIHPMGVGKPEYIAQAALYFASDESIWTTGTILPVDGGFAAI